MDFSVPVDNRGKMKENEKIDRYLDLAKKQKKSMEYKGDCDII